MSDTPEPGTMSAGELIDKLCDEFEQGWLSRNPFPLAEVIQAAPDSVRPDLFRELLAVEREYRTKDGRPVTVTEARTRFGRFGTWTESIIQELLATTEHWDYKPASEKPGPLSAALDARPDDLPVTVGGFKVLRRLGRGGMGAVYLADDPLGNRQVAIKLMHPQHAADQTARARFLREARSAMAVEHDNIVPVYQVGVDGDTPFLVMPVLKGESLEDRLTREPLPPITLVLKVGREIAAGLAAAHEKGLVHRDVKPANTWLDGDVSSSDPTIQVRRIKVLDFGLARTVDASDGVSISGLVVGTPAYMAPEQAAGQPVNGQADLFSLGAILYRMTTGKSAFPGATLTAVLTAIATHDPPPPIQLNPAVPPALSELVVRLLAKEPEQRPESAHEVVAALDAIEKGQPVAFANHQRSRTRTCVKRRVAVAIALLGVFGGAAVAGRFLSNRFFTSPVVVTEKANLTVLVRRPGFDPKPLSEVVPLQDGDSIQVRFRVPAGVYASLVYANGSGRLETLRSFEPREVAYEAIWPGSGEGSELGPPQGTEFLCVCGRTDRAPTVAELQEAWNADTSWPSLEPTGRFLCVRPEEITVGEVGSRDLGKVVAFPESDQVKQRLEQFRERLREFPVLDGVAFRHK